MDQEKFGQLIKKIRKANNLTQKQFADLYGVTYQAVSKWENGKNMPDLYLIKKISTDFNIDIDSMLKGNISSNKTRVSPKRNYVILISIFLLILLFILILYFRKDSSFEFKTLSTTCKNFKISGSIAYNNNKSSIYISNIYYSGKDSNVTYQKFECILYEQDNNLETAISKYTENTPNTLENFLKTVQFNIDDYTTICKHSKKDDSIYLIINAYNNNSKATTYKVPLSLKNNCSN